MTAAGAVSRYLFLAKHAHGVSVNVTNAGMKKPCAVLTIIAGIADVHTVVGVSSVTVAGM